MKAELFNFKCWVNNSDSDFLRETLDHLLSTSHFTKLGFIDHHFEPCGYTCIWLLAESHLAVHTYPEHEKSYVELTSCVEEKLEAFRTGLGEVFTIE